MFVQIFEKRAFIQHDSLLTCVSINIVLIASLISIVSSTSGSGISVDSKLKHTTEEYFQLSQNQERVHKLFDNSTDVNLTQIDDKVLAGNRTNENKFKLINNCSRCVRWIASRKICTLRQPCTFCNSTFPCKSRNQTCALDINICVNDYTAYYNDASLPRKTDPLGRIIGVILITIFILCVGTLFLRILSNACNASANLNDPGTDQRRCVHVQCTVDFGCCCNWKSGGINRLQNIRNSIPIQRGGGEHRTLNTSRNSHNTRRNPFEGTAHNRGDLLPPPPPAYIDIFPDHPNLVEEVQSYSDTTIDIATVVQDVPPSNETRSCLQQVALELERPITETILTDNTENQIDIETYNASSNLETDQVRPTTAQWLETLIVSLSRPTTSSASLPKEEEDNPPIVEINQTSNASTTNTSGSSFTTSSSTENNFSSNYTPSFYQATRPQRRHLFSKLKTRIGTGRSEIGLSEFDSRSSTPYLFNSRNPNLCTLNTSHETIINVETLQAGRDHGRDNNEENE